MQNIPHSQSFDGHRAADWSERQTILLKVSDSKVSSLRHDFEPFFYYSFVLVFYDQIKTKHETVWRKNERQKQVFRWNFFFVSSIYLTTVSNFSWTDKQSIYLKGLVSHNDLHRYSFEAMDDFHLTSYKIYKLIDGIRIRNHRLINFVLILRSPINDFYSNFNQTCNKRVSKESRISDLEDVKVQIVRELTLTEGWRARDKKQSIAFNGSFENVLRVVKQVFLKAEQNEIISGHDFYILLQLASKEHKIRTQNDEVP